MLKSYYPLLLFGLFFLVSFGADYQPGKDVAFNLLGFLKGMNRVLPCAFILIGLFEVWVKRETVEKHLGGGSGWKGYLWGIILAGTTVGGMYVALPVAYSLYRKGAGLEVIFTYLGASALVRVPMTIFEASFVGIKFSLIRLGVSLPLVIISACFLGRYLKARGYRLPAREER